MALVGMVWLEVGEPLVMLTVLVSIVPVAVPATLAVGVVLCTLVPPLKGVTVERYCAKSSTEKVAALPVVSCVMLAVEIPEPALMLRLVQAATPTGPVTVHVDRGLDVDVAVVQL